MSSRTSFESSPIAPSVVIIMHSPMSTLGPDATAVGTGSPDVVARRTRSRGFDTTKPLELPGRSSRRHGTTKAALSLSKDVPLSKKGPPVGQKKASQPRRLPAAVHSTSVLGNERSVSRASMCIILLKPIIDFASCRLAGPLTLRRGFTMFDCASHWVSSSCLSAGGI